MATRSAGPSSSTTRRGAPAVPLDRTASDGAVGFSPPNTGNRQKVIFYAVTAVLAVTVLVGLVRVAAGPTSGDRLVAALLFGTTGVALLVVLSVAADVPALRNVSFVLVVLAVLAVVVFVDDDVTAG